MRVVARERNVVTVRAAGIVGTHRIRAVLERVVGVHGRQLLVGATLGVGCATGSARAGGILQPISELQDVFVALVALGPQG